MIKNGNSHAETVCPASEAADTPFHMFAAWRLETLDGFYSFYSSTTDSNDSTRTPGTCPPYNKRIRRLFSPPPTYPCAAAASLRFRVRFA
jgi:hypothetical protein